MVRMTAAQGQNGIGPTHRPEHTRPLAARTDHGLAASFDDARTDEQVLAAELGVLHTLGVLGKILDLLTNRLGQFGVGRLNRVQGTDEFLEVPFVEQVLVNHHPAFLLRHVLGVELAR